MKKENLREKNITGTFFSFDVCRGKKQGKYVFFPMENYGEGAGKKSREKNPLKGVFFPSGFLPYCPLNAREMKGDDAIMVIEFFVPMKKVPTVTAQQKKISTKNKKPAIFDSSDLKAARQKLTDYIGYYGKRPENAYDSAVRLYVKWLFPISGSHYDGEWKTSKPDTDNLIKLLKDVMTSLGYWKDDALVASEINEKFYAANSGIYIRIEKLEGENDEMP